ncbi:sigma-54-dependent transcriptional regulator [Ferrimonas aestuarii]|uniref:Sigma-54-dependent Fis family transcriptional regulator n=1 Tax=Ferrimonas aestuarii TaxID=2569539 RepID=A0A4U1BU12_9GAMM|nr:sigma-54 dependent transcriptional regulator [Ferrimonas aestuarii]TKB58699.1 sigma-54-dependent Fis family transcriptional regulator [Ferrimonas aestuarii]
MKLARNILLVDDEAQWLRTLGVTLNRLVPEAKVDSCLDSRQVLQRMSGTDYALVLLDLTMPFHSGEEILAQIRQHHPNTRVIIVTGVNEVETAVRCIKQGAYDYFIKTGAVEELSISVRRALEVVGLERSLERVKQRFLSKDLDQPDAFGHILTCEPAMLDRLRYLEALTDSPAPVLIQGESGTGKDAFAKALHQLCHPNAPMITAQLTTLTEQAFDATLFGEVAQGDKPACVGLVHQAHGGTLYLDEIGELPLAMQSKLLHLLDHGHYFPVGSDRPIHAHCRIVASSQHDLVALAKEGRFRNDLLFRLKTHRIHLPPLRERQLDLPLLLNHFIARAAEQLECSAPQLPHSLVNALKDYPFPGNLIELKGMVLDAVSRSSDAQLNTAPFLEAVKDMVVTPTPSQTLQFPAELPTLAQASKALVDEAMSRTANNQTAAAALLGISQSALSRRLAKQ